MQLIGKASTTARGRVLDPIDACWQPDHQSDRLPFSNQSANMLEAGRVCLRRDRFEQVRPAGFRVLRLRHLCGPVRNRSQTGVPAPSEKKAQCRRSPLRHDRQRPRAVQVDEQLHGGGKNAPSGGVSKMIAMSAGTVSQGILGELCSSCPLTIPRSRGDEHFIVAHRRCPSAWRCLWSWSFATSSYLEAGMPVSRRAMQYETAVILYRPPKNTGRPAMSARPSGRSMRLEECCQCHVDRPVDDDAERPVSLCSRDVGDGAGEVWVGHGRHGEQVMGEIAGPG